MVGSIGGPSIGNHRFEVPKVAIYRAHVNRYQDVTVFEQADRNKFLDRGRLYIFVLISFPPNGVKGCLANVEDATWLEGVFREHCSEIMEAAIPCAPYCNCCLALDKKSNSEWGSAHFTFYLFSLINLFLLLYSFFV
jgi:hypothetical protein